MEKAIIKTLAYADIFDYPLRPYEIHKWLILQKATTYQIEKGIIRLLKKGKIQVKKDYLYLTGRQIVVKKRIERQKQSSKYNFRAQIVAFVLRIVPWIKLVGISGSLAVENAEKKSDIDLVIITSKERMWLTRLLTVWLTDFLGVRRRRNDPENEVGGKACINLFLEEDNLEQAYKDLYTAHEVLQMKVLWERDNIYEKFLDKNSWAFTYLPNWATSKASNSNLKVRGSKRDLKKQSFFLDVLEKIMEWVQRQYMKKPSGVERISEGELFFHPDDCRIKILQEYHQKQKKY